MHSKKTLYVLIGLSLLFSIGHHVDHIIRGNHVGFPINSDVNPFTYSLGFYPVIIIGIILFYKNILGPLFWSVLSGIGFLFVGLTHFGPFAAEPPHDIIEPYESFTHGILAITWLIVFLLLLLSICVYSFILHRRSR
jgi:hypothetical protein